MISVIISSYNRYDFMLNAIESVRNQTYKNTEIIVIDDGSTDTRYKQNIDDVKIIHLDEKNSRKVLGYPSCGYVRNFGFKIATGEYIAILDDDDYWLPDKLQQQYHILNKNNYLLCCTEAYIYEQPITNTVLNKELKLYNGEYWWKQLSKKMNFAKFPNIIKKEHIYKHNLIICSSVLFSKKVFELIKYMDEVPNWTGSSGIYQDWNYWKRIIKYSDIYYIDKPLLIYYKSGHSYV